MFLHISNDTNNSSSNWPRARRHAAHKLGGREIVTTFVTCDGDAKLAANTIQNHLGRSAGGKDYAFVEAGALTQSAVTALKKAGVNIVAAKGTDDFQTVAD